MNLMITEILAKKLRERKASEFNKSGNPFNEWYANLFTFNRAQYILVTNTSSLYSILMYGKGITRLDRFLEVFADFLPPLMAKDGCSDIFTKHIEPRIRPVNIGKTSNRSVLGSMNDMVKIAKICLSDPDRGPYDAAKIINKTYFSYIDNKTPLDRLKYDAGVFDKVVYLDDVNTVDEK